MALDDFERSKLSVHAAQHIHELEEIIRYCQDVLAEHLPPDGMSAQDAISCLLEVLDGPRTRSVLPNQQAR